MTMLTDSNGGTGISTNKKRSHPLTLLNSTPPPPGLERVICLYCGSSLGSDAVYEEAAYQLGKRFAEEKWGLVYGGGTTGIMGVIAKAVKSHGGYVHGVIPKALIEREQNSQVPDPQVYGKTTVVHDMHTRKRIMAQEADAFVALPGGYGTAEELLESITWNQLGIHSYPIVIFNVAGFYDGIFEFISKATTSGFISKGNSTIPVCANTVDAVINKIKSYTVAKDRFHLDWSHETPSLHPDSDDTPHDEN